MTPRYRGKHLELGVAAHAYMCESATLTPDQLALLAPHEMMDACDQTMIYAAAGVETVAVIDSGEHAMDVCKYLGMDIGISRDTIIEVRDLFKLLDERVLIRTVVVDEPTRIRPGQEPKRRDWEQRNRKQKRR